MCLCLSDPCSLSPFLPIFSLISPRLSHLTLPSHVSSHLLFLFPLVSPMTPLIFSLLSCLPSHALFLFCYSSPSPFFSPPSSPFSYSLPSLLFSLMSQGSAAAPIARSVLEFFLDFDIPLYELYGMSESTGPQTLSLYRTLYKNMLATEPIRL